MNEENKGVFRPLLLTITAIGIIIFSTIIVVKYLGLHFDILRLLSRNKVHEVTLASKNQPVLREPSETIYISQMAELREMLAEERFEDLNVILEEYQKFFL